MCACVYVCDVSGMCNECVVYGVCVGNLFVYVWCVFVWCVCVCSMCVCVVYVVCVYLCMCCMCGMCM